MRAIPPLRVGASRRRVLAALAAAMAIIPPARATEPRFPLRIAYLRLGKDGFLPVPADDQLLWTGLQTRLGGVIEAIEAIDPSPLIGAKAPEVDGGAASALAARKLAADQGFAYVILYAEHDGRRPPMDQGSWFAKALSSLTSDVGPRDRATGQAYLLDVDGGAPLASATTDVDAGTILNSLTGRQPGRETLIALTQLLERRIEALAGRALAAETSRSH